MNPSAIFHHRVSFKERSSHFSYHIVHRQCYRCITISLLKPQATGVPKTILSLHLKQERKQARGWLTVELPPVHTGPKFILMHLDGHEFFLPSL